MNPGAGHTQGGPDLSPARCLGVLETVLPPTAPGEVADTQVPPQVPAAPLFPDSQRRQVLPAHLPRPQRELPEGRDRLLQPLLPLRAQTR